MAKVKDKKNNLIKNIGHLTRINLLPIILSALLLILIVITYQVVLMDKFFPFTFVDDTNISLLTQSEAKRILQAKFDRRVQAKLNFDSFTIDLTTSSASLDYDILEQTFAVGHQGPFWERLKQQFLALIYKSQLSPNLNFNIEGQIETIAQAVYQPTQDAQLTYDETVTPEGSPSANIQIKEAKNGLELDKTALKKEVENYLVSGQYQNQLPKREVLPKINTQHMEKAKKALEKTLTSPIKLKFAGNIWVLDTKQLLVLLDLTSDENLLLDKEKTYSYLDKIASEINQEVQEGLFEFNPKEIRVTAFRPSWEGRKLDIEKTYDMIEATLTNKQTATITLPVNIIQPKIQTEDVNSLGIKELLGRGISHFTGSIQNRIYNIGLAASRINGILIPPQETFSFNEKVGDISSASGYKQAYVIKEGRTVLDDGGGVCQDSTTLFRAVLNAGLPVVQRVAHAYRVGYYEQGFPPGLDATVFAPSVDFKFTNDTKHHILIQAYTVGTTLYVDLYGTSDGRVASLTKSTVTNQTPPPPELRQDDPNLPKGEVKQVDFPAWGATVNFSRTVKRGGETLIQETFKSNYKAWQAVYLVGTKD